MKNGELLPHSQYGYVACRPAIDGRPGGVPEWSTFSAIRSHAQAKLCRLESELGHEGGTRSWEYYAGSGFTVVPAEVKWGGE